MPDATLSSLFPVALRKVDLWGEPKGAGSWGFPILSWLNIMATLLFPLKNDKGVLNSHFYGIEVADKLDNSVSFPLWYLYHCSISSLEPWSFNNCSKIGVQKKVSIWRISEHAWFFKNLTDNIKQAFLPLRTSMVKNTEKEGCGEFLAKFGKCHSNY